MPGTFLFFKGFRGGVHPSGMKTRTSGKEIIRLSLPKKVTLPLVQHIGVPCKPTVKAGDMVKAGDRIGAADAFITSPVHASISGKILTIADLPHPVLGKCASVVIERTEDAGDDPVGLPSDKSRSIENISKEKLLEAVRSAGIVGMGGAAFPTHVKLSPPKNKPIDIVILNGAECEPYLTCDYRLMMERAGEVLQGLAAFAKILAPERVIIAVEDNKVSAAAVMERAIADHRPQTADFRPEIIILKTKYPQGAEKQLIKSAVNRVVPAGGLPMDVGCVVQNVGTALAVYEAVCLDKPLIERCVTVTGPCIKEPKNLLVRLGTPLQELIDECGGFSKDPKKIIFGGPMMGIAQYTRDLPIIKGTSGILVLSDDEMKRAQETACIRCGRCFDHCPMNLMPASLMNYVKKERYDDAAASGIAACIECGACAYGCPAAIPLVDYMKLGKAELVVKKK
ncbi:MAG: electron transport complex subunit RsxC [Candidatus Omnitrophota bacterium]